MFAIFQHDGKEKNCLQANTFIYKDLFNYSKGDHFCRFCRLWHRWLIIFLLNLVQTKLNKTYNMTSVKSSSLGNIRCKTENHSNMPFQYICLNQKCVKFNQHLLCFHCCQQLHMTHVNLVKSLKQILKIASTQITKSKCTKKDKTSEKEFQCLKILTNGIEKCRSEQELRRTSSQLLKILTNGSINRFQSIFNQQLSEIHQKVVNFYSVKQQQSQNKNRSIIKKQQSISPFLTFSQLLDSKQFTCQSPFQIRSIKNQSIVTAFVSPSLSVYSQDSIYVRVKIQNLTPNWLAVGFSIGQSKYQTDSKNHIMLLSNGWLHNFGTLQKCGVGFNIGDIVSIRWNISKKKLQFECHGEKTCATVQRKWDQQVFLCVSMFYANNSISIVQ